MFIFKLSEVPVLSFCLASVIYMQEYIEDLHCIVSGTAEQKTVMRKGAVATANTIKLTNISLKRYEDEFKVVILDLMCRWLFWGAHAGSSRHCPFTERRTSGDVLTHTPG